ncbi:MAG: YitT family protein [Pseudobdellovibrio sp.]
MHKIKKNYFKSAREIVLILLGILSAAIGLKGFLLPNGFFDGGAMGISLLLNHFVKTDLSIFIVAINIPFVLIGLKQVSIEFAIKSAIAILILALLVHWIHIPVFTEDKLLIAVFGGVFLGLGIGLSIRGGAVIDGTEVLAIQVSRKSSLSVGDFIAVFNFMLFVCVAFLVNLETAMYSMLTYAAASKSVDFVLNGIEEYIGVTIISPKFEIIRKMLVHDLQRGVTVYKTEGGYGKSGSITEERKVLFCAVTRLEVSKLLAEIDLLDPEAFVIQHSIKDTRGGMIKKRPLH